MRRYIRHPATVPITYSVDSSAPLAASLQLKQKCLGLCFHTGQAVTQGAKIHLRIPLGELTGGNASVDSFEADGTVVWCRPEARGYTVAVDLEDHTNRYVLRMVEQLCHIEAYREYVEGEQGRALSQEEAAQEWIEKYAAAFPSY